MRAVRKDRGRTPRACGGGPPPPVPPPQSESKGKKMADENTLFERDMKMLEKGILTPEEFRKVWRNEEKE